jgi:hypothetical protein
MIFPPDTRLRLNPKDECTHEPEPALKYGVPVSVAPGQA